MAHIEKRADRRYRARYRGADGKERSRTFARKIDAETFLATTQADKARGVWVDERLANVLYKDWAAQWLRTTVHLKPKTIDGYDSLLRTQIFPTFGDIPIGRIEPLHVKAWVAGLVAADLSSSRIRQAYRVFSATMKAAVESGQLVKTPCVGVKLPRLLQTEVRFLDAGQVETLVGAAGAGSRVLLYVLAYGGLRWGEACALRRRNCEILRSRLRVAESLAEVKGELHFGTTKTHRQRIVVLPAFLRDLLAEHLTSVALDPDALVFTDDSGEPLRHSPFWRDTWDPARTAARMESFKIHELRHTCAALRFRQGRPPEGHPAAPRPLDDHRDDGPLRPPVPGRDGSPGGSPGRHVAGSPQTNRGLTAAWRRHGSPRLNVEEAPEGASDLR